VVPLKSQRHHRVSGLSCATLATQAPVARKYLPRVKLAPLPRRSCCQAYSSQSPPSDCGWKPHGTGLLADHQVFVAAIDSACGLSAVTEQLKSPDA